MSAQSLRPFIGLLVAALILAACDAGLETKTDQPPAEVGGRFSIGGFSFGGKEEKFGYTGELSAEEAALREQARKFDQTVWQGLLIGAVVGTAVGAVAGGDTQGAVGGAIVGAGVGAIAGMYVARMQQRYANTEDQLDAMIGDVRNSNRATESLIADVQTVIAEDRRRLAAVQAKVARGQATAADLTQERGRAWGNRRVVEKAALGGQDQYRVFEGAIQRFQQKNPGVKTANFERELKGYRTRLEDLDRLAAGMAKA
ncbi:MAG TPA: glycine zipper domain-containing protein [Lamprocystis sp. (in: g-proteobacteria)]|nr:glycine zipper domain-containing protein [Lamprocystis sp. (in: g-proteobacteria)]